MFIINFCLNMFRASLCPSSGDQRPCVTAYGVLLWFCWMWLVVVVGRCVVGCEHCEGYCWTVTFTVLTSYMHRIMHRWSYTCNLVASAACSSYWEVNTCKTGKESIFILLYLLIALLWKRHTYRWRRQFCWWPVGYINVTLAVKDSTNQKYCRIHMIFFFCYRPLSFLCTELQAGRSWVRFQCCNWNFSLT